MSMSGCAGKDWHKLLNALCLAQWICLNLGESGCVWSQGGAADWVPQHWDIGDVWTPGSSRPAGWQSSSR
jgi:hypothetical protein